VFGGIEVERHGFELTEALMTAWQNHLLSWGISAAATNHRGQITSGKPASRPERVCADTLLTKPLESGEQSWHSIDCLLQ
jgi:hypothetical protein